MPGYKGVDDGNVVLLVVVQAGLDVRSARRQTWKKN
jgi:hypothetical protein